MSTSVTDPPRGLAAALLDDDASWMGMARRAGIGLALSSLYGIALGARGGLLPMAQHAVGVPAALLAVAALGGPALYIVLALFNAPISPERVVSAAVRGSASAGLVLAGLAPLAAIYVVGSESNEAASLSGTLGLVLGGALGLRQLVATVREALKEADSATRTLAMVAQIGFGLFAVVLAMRVWTAVLPLIGGAR
jgi:hypothetical protein